MAERLSNEKVMALPYDELVRYCDSLLTPDAAMDILLSSFIPTNERHKFGASHCKNGHEFTEENQYFRNGKRYCRACGRAYRQRFKAKHVA